MNIPIQKYIANRKLFNSMKRERCICSAISIKSPVL